MSRINFIDFAKGIGILLIVMCHVGIKQEQIYIFYAAQVPLFFVLSGLFFEKSYQKGRFIIKKVNTILAPFMVYYLLSYVIFYILKAVVGGTNPMVSNYSGAFDILSQRLLFNGPIWFLLCLFEVELMFYLLFRFFTNKVIKILICIGLFIVGCILGNKQMFIPLKIDASFVAMPFFYLGILLGREKWFVGNMKWGVALVLAVLSFVPYLIFPCKIDMNAGLYMGNTFLLWLGCLGLVMCIIFISKAFCYNVIINWLGVNSLVIMCTHHLVYRPVKLGLSMVGGADPVRILILTLMIEVPVVLFINKYCSMLTGKFYWMKYLEK